MIVDDGLDTGTGMPLAAKVVIGALAVVGVLTVVGWAFSLLWTVIRLALLVAIVMGIIWAVKASRRA